MADLQSWRRHTQLAKPTENICYGHMTDFAPSDDTSCSTSPGADEKKLRPPPTRSLASFASYLGTHRRNVCPNSRPEGPSIDWPNVNGVNDKDSVYKPDIELMCTTITQSVLANPYADLPAHYNTFLLRLIEAYHQAKADLQELQMKLAEETECKQTTVDEFHGAIPSWPLARARMPQSSENASSNTLHTTVVTGPIEEAITAKLREYSFTIHTSKSSIDYDNVGQKPRQAEKPRTSERYQLTSSARRLRELSTAATGVESSRDHWLPSPFQHGRDFIDCDASSTESEGEEHRVLMSVSDAFSGFEDSIASCLVGWLALRLKYQRPADIISELSELLRANQKELQKVIAPRTIGTLRPSMPTAFGPVFSSGKNQIPHGPSNKLKGTRGSPSFQSIRSLTHRRCFSFLPGDDSTNPILFDASGGQDRESDMNLIRHLVWQDTRQSDRGGSGEFAKNEVSGGLAVGSTSQQRLRNSVAPSTAGSDTIRNPRRHGSGKSVLTAIISSSS